MEVKGTESRPAAQKETGKRGTNTVLEVADIHRMRQNNQKMNRNPVLEEPVLDQNRHKARRRASGVGWTLQHPQDSFSYWSRRCANASVTPVYAICRAPVYPCY